ncbi:MAG TPA: maleylpyruvate isomerase N-terminal domain-containing protein [Acidimicrobiales bacterium]|nr:maleylpyruvate isomerase N-terminal domain-containing protein [Acidimicrobiales bacterium]
MPATSQAALAAAREAVATVGPRVSGLLRTARHPNVPALGEWDLTDTAVHLSLSADALCALVEGAGAMLTDLWDLGTLNKTLVEGETTRDLPRLADRIDATVTRFLTLVGDAEDDAARPWVVEGVAAPLSMLTCQMLNELVVHGRDIAMAEGVPWPIDRRHAALVLTGFLFPSMAGLGRALVDQEKAAAVRVAYDVRLRGGGRVVLRFDDGDLTVEPEPSARVDCHLSVDPVTFMLVAWGRIGQAQGILKGQLFAWGRKPWLGLKLRSLLRNP